MIVILKQNCEKQRVDKLIERFKALGLSINYSEGSFTTILGLIGDTSKLDVESILANDFVETVKRISEPYKAANRKFHPNDTIVDVDGVKIGQGFFTVAAGPCSIESENQLISIAESVKKGGAKLLRGGAFKPRTSPYSFQGLHNEGINLLLKAKKHTGLPVVTEIMSLTHLDLFSEVDIIQVGARNMQNFELLKELGKCQKPILLKRGLANTIEEFIMSAEYILAGGNGNVVLCERGIRSFETMTRNTLDISAIPLLKQKTHLPVIVDPSHAAGISALVHPLSKAAVAAGADGLMIEVHNDPAHAMCDGDQSLTPESFAEVMQSVNKMAQQEGRTF